MVLKPYASCILNYIECCSVDKSNLKSAPTKYGKFTFLLGPSNIYKLYIFYYNSLLFHNYWNNSDIL